ncbi:MAG: hypothetical protein ACR2HD_02215 [Solirubrobacteraceae bacterium]
MEAATAPERTPQREGASSFAKSLFLGEIHEDLVFPYPYPDADDRRKIGALVRSVREFGETYDERAVEERGWIGDREIADLGERCLLGLYVPRSTAAPASHRRATAAFRRSAQIDATLSVIMGGRQVAAGPRDPSRARARAVRPAARGLRARAGEDRQSRALG